MASRYRVVGINFDHFHMGDLLRMVFDHPDCEITGISDPQPARMVDVAERFSIPPERVTTDYATLIQETRPDLVVLCPAAARHAEWVEQVAPLGCDLLLEKPMAATVSEADRMIAAAQAAKVRLAINWPLVWVPAHRTAKRLIDEGEIGTVLEVHYYDGNRGPLWHVADKVERTAEQVEAEKPNSWFYRKDQGGGSLLDYLGYGTTLGTWFMNGRRPIEVTALWDRENNTAIEVDQHSVTIARYETGLSKFETRWGTFTDPWIHQPQPRCGFVIVGERGTIASYDYAESLMVQTHEYPAGREVPVDVIPPPLQNPIQYMIDVIAGNGDVEGPLSTQISRIGQQIVDAAVLSAEQKRTVSLVEIDSPVEPH